MYNFILNKDFSNNDSSSMITKQYNGRLHTYNGEADNYVVEMDDDNTIYFDKILNTCYVNKFSN